MTITCAVLAHEVGHASMRRGILAAFLCALCVFISAGRAFAYSNGAGSECTGCHSGGKEPTVTITPDSTTILPGQMVTLTLSISQTNGPEAGFFLQSNGHGTFTLVDSGTRFYADGVTHTAPRTGSGGQTVFKVAWTAPETPGGVDLTLYGNSVNGDGRSSGDLGSQAFFTTTYGCVGNKYYHDYDADGVGALSSGYTMDCTLPAFFSAVAGDCNDNDATVYPGAPEICDGKDNNCNGMIDEGLKVDTYCADADGDGHGAIMGAMTTSCMRKGLGLCDNDCNDHDSKIYPGAPELCNGIDDNCNGMIDEGARPVCGVGWCARYAASCSSPTCTPGLPRAEECNDFDDDCDGVSDNGSDLALCGQIGLACKAGVCVPVPGAGANTVAGHPAAGAGNSGGAPASGNSGGAPSVGSGSPPGSQPSSGIPSGGSAQAAGETPTRSEACSYGRGNGRGEFALIALSAAYWCARRRRRAQ
jgi:hypothetical protein